MTIIEALRDPRVLGALPAFKDLSSWKAWLVFLCGVYGLPLASLRPVGVSEGDALEVWRRHTGRPTYAPPTGGYSEAAAIVGRQSGKTRIAGTIVAYEGLIATPEPDGTEIYGALVSQDARAALRTVFSYTTAPFDTVPALKRVVPSGWRGLIRKARRADSLRLETGMVIAAYPCRPSAVRGIRARVVICDELAFFRSSEGYPTDVEMLRAVRPTLATTGGKLIILSSPYGQTGALWDLHRKHFGRDDSTTLVWQADAPSMNPTLSADYLSRMEADDPEAYRSEVLGEFRQGIATFLDGETLAACVDTGVRERSPIPGTKYRAHYDASGGSKDSAAVAIGHTTRDAVVVDVVRAWPAPHNPASVIGEACDVLRRYGISEVTGDRYAGEFVAEQFRSRGVSYLPSELDRSGLYLDILPRINAGEVRLLDDAETLKELRGLERRRGASGRDKVDHRPGAHDDRAVAVAGVVAGLGSTTACRSPLCDDPACDGRGPWFMGTPESRAWSWRHDPATIAEFEASRERIARALAVADRLGRDAFLEIEAAGGGEDAIERVVSELLRQEVA